MPIATKRLASWTSQGTRESSTAYTVPAGFRTIVKDIVITNGAASSAVVQIYLAEQSGASNVLQVWETIEAAKTVQRSAWSVLHEGDTIVLYADVANVRFWISGTELVVF